MASGVSDRGRTFVRARSGSELMQQVQRRDPLSLRLRRSGRRGLAPGSTRLAAAVALVALATFFATVSAAAATTYDMRGEWDYSTTCTCGVGVSGTMVIREMELATGAFSGTTLVDGALQGTISGTVTGTTTLSFEAILPSTPEGRSTFTMTSGSLEAATNSFTGSGYYDGGGSGEPTGTITAQLVRSLAQIEKEEAEAAQRAKEEKEAREKREAEETKTRELKEAEEKVAREKAEAEKSEREAQERPAKEKAEREAKEKQQAAEQQAAKEREAKASAEKAAAEKVEAEKREREAGARESAQLVPVAPTSRTPAVKGGGIGIALSNTNAFAVSGSVSLSEASTHGKTSRRHRATMLGRASFAIAAKGSTIVEVRLAKTARAALSRGRTLHVLLEITTTDAGHASAVKRYTLELTAGGSHRSHR